MPGLKPMSSPASSKSRVKIRDRSQEGDVRLSANCEQLLPPGPSLKLSLKQQVAATHCAVLQPHAKRSRQANKELARMTGCVKRLIENPRSSQELKALRRQNRSVSG
mmetsp:Transcript_61639/g.127698  ORF Transcript_61639/g.127698 Transcript_61639/m.127698 type:complete len:107 (-) Transcript_61639:46-366(-)